MIMSNIGKMNPLAAGKRSFSRGMTPTYYTWLKNAWHIHRPCAEVYSFWRTGTA